MRGGDHRAQSVGYELGLLEAMELMRDEEEEERRLMLQTGSWSAKEVYGLEIAEVFSPPRITEAGRRKGCLSGIAFHLRTQDKDGNAWDLSKPEVQEKAEELVDLLQPELIVGCPPRGPFSALQCLNHPKMTEQQVQDRMKDAVAHVEFCVKLYRKQISRRKFFLHEHPSRASSWKLECMEEITQEDGVQKVESDMCAYGMSSGPRWRRIGQEAHRVSDR